MWLNKTRLPFTYTEISGAGPRGQYGGEEKGSQGQGTGNSKEEDSVSVGQGTVVSRMEDRS